jgi:hypothetical protein
MFGNGINFHWLCIENGMKMVIFVIPAQARIQSHDVSFWIPACAGMTGKKRPICPRLRLCPLGRGVYFSRSQGIIPGTAVGFSDVPQSLFYGFLHLTSP